MAKPASCKSDATAGLASVTSQNPVSIHFIELKRFAPQNVAMIVMRLSRVSFAVSLLAVGCDSKLSKFPFVAVSGSRLKIQAYDGGVPVRLSPVTFFDSKFELDCIATKAADNKLRCLPGSVDGGTTYSDAGCATRAYISAGCTEVEPKFIQLAESDDSAYCSTDTFDANLSRVKGTKVFAVGAKAKGTVYAKESNGTCVVFSSTATALAMTGFALTLCSASPEWARPPIVALRLTHLSAPPDVRRQAQATLPSGPHDTAKSSKKTRSELSWLVR